ncbi:MULTISPECIES: polysaccharide biosynthesis/export family protein [Kordiimonas]|jgi:protein involved in polysaccharide export with SLBB domain|uniref:Protein involved in polysaccharide export, contains SLBB domain of the beta-grasp fold n=1 Tax=Kordiimonas lacus TaxID=637679 RepID=A0A1G7F8I4_9PROT|nr:MULTISPECIES: polysaccharide biosynthesis/export family protein [Kordiimonas]SDE72248.1 protein involved in polysaccharide export, contains SLBB domain of the beta-grasp fold [Kordiimonas lacus]
MFNALKKKPLEALKVGLAALVLMGASSSVLAQAVPPLTQNGAPVEENTNEVIDRHEAFGNWIFGGQFANQSFIGFNPSYEIAVGDKISLKMWGGFEFTGELVVDAQGNVFLPEVGPIAVQGVRNEDLNAVVTESVKRVFKKNVGVYASLDGAEPVKIFVTGFVEQPGLYAGHASDSVLFFLDQAGGVDPNRGSFLEIKVLRGGQVYRTVNLYDFILTGIMPVFQLSDGDTIVVTPVKAQAGVLGDVQNSNLFEFTTETVAAGKLLALARPQPQATHVRISRNSQAKSEVEYIAIAQAANVPIYPGDVLHVMSDKSNGTISVRVEGETDSAREFVLPYGARLGDLIEQIDFGKNAQRNAIQLMRKSVKMRQKEMLEAQLRALESSVLTARSNTTKEAELRKSEAELILKWVERARNVEPNGQVALAGASSVNDILLEPGDVIRIPRTSSLVMVHGDVLFPSAMAFQDGRTVEEYIEQAGGFTQSRRNTNVLLLHRDGSFQKVKNGDLDSRRVQLVPGDEIFVLPRVATKHVQIASDIINIFYQLALSAGVVLRL